MSSESKAETLEYLQGLSSENSQAASSRPASGVSTKSVRVARDEQERMRAEYLRDQGFVGRSSAESATSSNKTDVSEKVKAIQRRLDALPPMQIQDSSPTLVGCRDSGVSHVMKALDASGVEDKNKISERRASYPYHLVAAPNAGSNTLSAPRPAPKRYRLRGGFAAARNSEADNWFTSRGSRTLPHRFEPPETLQDPISELSKASPTGHSSRAASLRIRNSRLPPGYSLPHDSASLIKASASKYGTDQVHEGFLDCVSSPSKRVGAIQRMSRVDDDNTISGPSSWSSVPDNVRSPPRDLAAMTGGEYLSLEALDRHPRKPSQFSDTSEDEDLVVRPELPSRSTERLSVRNSTGLSSRGDVAWPILEPVESQTPGPTAPEPKKDSKTKRRSMWVGFLLVILWTIATALTIFGISNTLPFALRPLTYTGGGAQACSPPALSFVHDLRMSTSLPKSLQPYLATLELGNIEDVEMTDLGLKLNVHGTTNVQQVHIYGGLVISTSFAKNDLRLVSNITYAGVVDRSEDEKKARSTLNTILSGTRGGRSEDAVSIVSAQGASRTMTMTEHEDTRGVFLSLWLTCLLAAEVTLLVYFATKTVLWITTVRFGKKSDAGGERPDVMEVKESSWKQELRSIFPLVIPWGFASVLGSALAGGVVVVLERRA